MPEAVTFRISAYHKARQGRSRHHAGQHRALPAERGVWTAYFSEMPAVRCRPVPAHRA